MRFKNPFTRGNCSKCGIWYDNAKLGVADHPEIKEVCESCRKKRAFYYIDPTVNRWVACSDCIFFGYSLDPHLGKHGKCTGCKERYPRRRFKKYSII